MIDENNWLCNLDNSSAEIERKINKKIKTGLSDFQPYDYHTIALTRITSN